MINSLLSLFALSPGQSCGFTNSSFLNFPYWYQYLNGTGMLRDPQSPAGPTNPVICTNPQFNGLNDVWLIVAALIEILLRLATLAAIGVIIYSAIRFITSQGDPEDTKKARSTIINALVGLLLSVMAAVIVNFIAGSINN